MQSTSLRHFIVSFMCVQPTVFSHVPVEVVEGGVAALTASEKRRARVVTDAQGKEVVTVCRDANFHKEQCEMLQIPALEGHGCLTHVQKVSALPTPGTILYCTGRRWSISRRRWMQAPTSLSRRCSSMPKFSWTLSMSAASTTSRSDCENRILPGHARPTHPTFSHVQVPIVPGIMCLNGFGGLKRMTELCKTRLPEGFPVADVAVYQSEDKGSAPGLKQVLCGDGNTRAQNSFQRCASLNFVLVRPGYHSGIGISSSSSSRRRSSSASASSSSSSS